MKLLLALLRDRRLVAAIGVLALLALIWFGGGLLKLSVTVRLACFAVVFVGAAIAYIVSRILAARRATQLESALWAQADAQAAEARPEHKEEIQALKQQLKEAVTALKGSKLGRGVGRGSALYALPWYMIIGPPASGKSTALLHSGLNFPFTGSGGHGVQGIGGTRNCDWWFTDQAVLLDTAGRYTTGEEDRDEWIAFLDMLKRYRPKKPINGVLVGVSVADLLEGGDGQVAAHAKRIRERIDELINHLGVQFPVYVLFTKCDLIPGFVESFGDLDSERRGQVWGVTLPLGAGPVAGETLAERCRELVRRLGRRRLARLGEVRVAREQLLVYAFPEQIAAATPTLRAFMEALFAANPYQENPLFRGFYLTSGTQEGSPIDRLITSMGEAFRISGIGAVIAQEREKKSYFLRDLFTTVVFPDRDIAGPTRRAGRRSSWLAAGSLTLAILLLFGGGAVVTFSWLANRTLLHQVDRAVAAIGQAPPASAERWVAVDRLGTLAARLDRYDTEGPPLYLRGGLYSGNLVTARLRGIYLAHLRELFLVGAVARLGGDITAAVRAGDEESVYPLLKAYLMAGEPRTAEGSVLREALEARWASSRPLPTETVPAAELDAIASRIFAAYLAQIGRDDCPAVAPDDGVVGAARGALNAIPQGERLYAILRGELLHELPPLTLATATHWQREALLVDPKEVPGMFTRQGYKERVTARMEALAAGSVADAWVLGSGGQEKTTDATALYATMERLYARDYQEAWTAFLAALSMVPIRDTEDAVGKLDLLAGPDSPLPALFQTVAENTNFDEAAGSAVSQSTLSKVTGVVGRKLGIGATGQELARDKVKELAERKEPRGGMAAVTDHFAPLRALVAQGEGKDPSLSLDEYRAKLAALRDRLTGLRSSDDPDQAVAAFALGVLTDGAGNEVRSLLAFSSRLADRLGPDLRGVVRPLLTEVVGRSYRGVLAETQAALARGWAEEVARPYRERLAGRYPFDASGREEVPLGEVTDFFQPGQGAFWRYFDKRLAPFLREGKGGWQPRVWMDAGIEVGREARQAIVVARGLTDALFPRGAQVPAATFQIRIRPTPGLEEIDLLVDDHRERYRMTPEEWVPLTWPGAFGSGKAAVEVVPMGGGPRRVLQYEGAWALFRLLDAATIELQSRTSFVAQWQIGEAGTRKTPVSIDVQASAYANPFRPPRAADFRPPGRLDL